MITTITDFVAQLNDKFPPTFPSDSGLNERFMFTEGKRYYKVSFTRDGITPNSVYAFIDKTTGDLYKPANWQAPAKHVRGNINNKSGIAACNRHSVVYLR